VLFGNSICSFFSLVRLLGDNHEKCGSDLGFGSTSDPTGALEVLHILGQMILSVGPVQDTLAFGYFATQRIQDFVTSILGESHVII
jgi:hypothetical protein